MNGRRVIFDFIDREIRELRIESRNETGFALGFSPDHEFDLASERHYLEGIPRTHFALPILRVPISIGSVVYGIEHELHGFRRLECLGRKPDLKKSLWHSHHPFDAHISHPEIPRETDRDERRPDRGEKPEPRERLGDDALKKEIVDSGNHLNIIPHGTCPLCLF